MSREIASSKGRALASAALAGILTGLAACSATPAATEVVVQPGASVNTAGAAADTASPGDELADQADPAPTAEPSAAPAKRPKRHKTGQTAAGAKGCCMGKNMCKGQGGCKTILNACKGQNDCRGKGGCKTGTCDDTLSTPAPPPPGYTVSPSKGMCCKGQNDCKGMGGCRGPCGP